MEDNGYHCAYSKREALRNGRSKSEPISKVVDGISEDDEPGYGLDLL